jgi:V-type H+-transporting ATPase subunit a
MREMQSKDESVLRMIAGVIPEDRLDAFERVVWRASRGKAVLRTAPEAVELLERDANAVVKKRAFALFFIGGFLKKKSSLIAQSFSATEYDVGAIADTDARLAQIAEEIESKVQLSRTTRDDIVQTLRAVAKAPDAGAGAGADSLAPLREWQVRVRKEVSICDALKRARATSGDFLQLEAWCPTADVDRVSRDFAALMAATGLKGACELVEFDSAVKMPPTYFKVNRLTATYQGMIDTYGVPRYREANPALFTIITFPFLFGVMYGDIGHSVALIAFALYLIIFERSLAEQQRRGTIGEMTGMMFNGRYMLLSMGVFAHYAGWIYNDMLSLSVNAFGSAYAFPAEAKAGTPAVRDATAVYPFGVDPIWSRSNQDLSFYNSLKMKMSVSIGVVQMTFGVFLSLANKIYFGDTSGIFLEFVPQILFMLCLFGYMIFLILFKWSVDWSNPAETRSPPNLIQTMMNMVLKPGQVAPKEMLFAGQDTLQAVLVLIAVISVPIMLFGKPVYLTLNKPKRSALASAASSSSSDPDALIVDSGRDADDDADASHRKGHSSSDEHEHEDGHSFGDMMIHQSIHTIEYVLGTVSNTASYLRLWALSLAHSELSKVFWDKIFMLGLNSGNWAMVIVCFGAWFFITSAVLLMMDVLECFLHALRLHWVEFQNKFFEASGYSFVPFTLKQETGAE